MRARWPSLLVLVLLAGVPAGAQAATPPPVLVTIRAPAGDPEMLSDEQTFTRWAHVTQVSEIYQRPAVTAPRMGRLYYYTEDGFPEVYLLLQSVTDSRGRPWVQLRIPGRPNGRVGWVPRAMLGPFHLTTQLLVVNRSDLRLSLYDSGRLVWRAPIGVGKPASPTPAGRFWIREVFKIGDRHSGYYPYAFGTADYSTLTDWPGGGVVGIHGPYYQPQLIPGRISHGCIRLRVSDDAWLGSHLKVGTPLRVL